MLRHSPLFHNDSGAATASETPLKIRAIPSLALPRLPSRAQLMPKKIGTSLAALNVTQVVVRLDEPGLGLPALQVARLITERAGTTPAAAFAQDGHRQNRRSLPRSKWKRAGRLPRSADSRLISPQYPPIYLTYARPQGRVLARSGLRWHP